MTENELEKLKKEVDDLSQKINNQQLRWSNKRDIYIDAKSGNDNNNGSSKYPVKTVTQAIKLMNLGLGTGKNNNTGGAQVGFVFKTSDEYHIPYDLHIASGTVLHLITDIHSTEAKARLNDNSIPANQKYVTPTLIFDYPAGASADKPHIYSSHIHIDGMATKDYCFPIKISTPANYLYFEHCRLMAHNVEFKCPVSVAGGNFLLQNCIFNENSAYGAQFYAHECNGIFNGFSYFKGINKNGVQLKQTLVQFDSDFVCNQSSERRKTSNLALVDAAASVLFINENLIPNYVKLSKTGYPNWEKDGPYPIKMNPNSKGYADIAQLVDSNVLVYNEKWGNTNSSFMNYALHGYDYIISSKLSYINATENFRKNTNRWVQISSNKSHIYTNRLYLQQTSFNEKYLEDIELVKRNNYMGYGYIFDEGKKIKLCFPLGENYPNMTRFPRIETKITSVKPITDINMIGNLPSIKSVSGELSELLTKKLQTCNRIIRKAETPDTIVFNNRVINSTFNPKINFNKDQAEVELTITLGDEFKSLNNTPIVFYFGTTKIDAINYVPVRIPTTVYATEDLKSENIQIKANTIVYVTDYDNHMWRKITPQIVNGVEYSYIYIGKDNPFPTASII